MYIICNIFFSKDKEMLKLKTEKKLFKLETTFPFHNLLVLEHCDSAVLTSSTLLTNHFFCIVESQWLLAFCYLLKNETTTQQSFLIESSAEELTQNTLTNQNIADIVLFHQFYCLAQKLRVTLVLAASLITVKSIDTIYQNVNWLERETKEMYSLFFYHKLDCRNLLLDYTDIQAPMQKMFPTEGVKDVFFNVFYNNVSYEQTETTEL